MYLEFFKCLLKQFHRWLGRVGLEPMLEHLLALADVIINVPMQDNKHDSLNSLEEGV